VHYYLSDHLGSASVVAGVVNSVAVVQDESDYYPYGGEIPIINTDPNAYKFTGKERDTESGLDNFGARYDSSNLGRFITPDWDAKPVTVPYAVLGDPQTLNLYSYVENGPVNRVDADGHQNNSQGKTTDTSYCPPPTPGSDRNTCGPVPAAAVAEQAAKKKVAEQEAINTKPPTPKPPKLNGTNPVTGQPGLATNPKGVPGNMRAGAPGTGQGNFGARRDGGRQHKGFDISGRSHFDMAMSWKEGTVTRVGNDPNGYGTYVDVSHGDGLTSSYAHLSAVGVEKGEGVTEGEVLGRCRPDRECWNQPRERITFAFRNTAKWRASRPSSNDEPSSAGGLICCEAHESLHLYFCYALG
jgi:RHS repeat-associated protein